MADDILIVGAGGFVGKHLVDALTARGERVIAVVRHPLHAAMNPAVEVQIIRGNDPVEYLSSLQTCRVVIHVASASTPGSSAAQPLLELEENLRPTLALLQALQQRPELPLIYVSSGGTLYGRHTHDHAAESAPIAPRSYHGAGKIAAEHFIATWCNQFRASATILRPSNLYGPGQVERAGFGIIPTAFGKIMRGETLHVWGDGSALRDYLYIDDFIRLCVAVLDDEHSQSADVVNACCDLSVSLNELFAFIEAVTGKTLQRSYDASRAVDMQNVAMQATRARQHYGWAPIVTLREGIERTWAWFKTIPH